MTAIREVVAKLAPGRDAAHISETMHDLTRRTQSMARGGPVQFALSGLDIALWDIAGKAVGLPVWRLLGGNDVRASIPAYASLFRIGTPDQVARVAATAVERGYRHIKLHEHGVAAVAAARRAIGPDVSLMVDTNCHWQEPADIIAICAELEQHDVAWLEEPLYPADDYDVMARIRGAVRVPLAAGENLGNTNDVRWITDARAVDVVQPSVAKLGGITAMRKAVSYIEAHGLRAVPHSPFLGPALMATIHVIAAMRKPVICEHRFCDLAASPLGDAVISRDGHLAVPDRPGLGFEIDQAVIEKYRVQI
jgi:L-alanine-DL-glutamate epimerase-like enolase superfamily enzyme